MSTVTDAVPEASHELELVERQSVPGRLGTTATNYVRWMIGLPWHIRISRAAFAVPKIRYWEAKYQNLTDGEMRECGLRLRGLARGGANLDRMLPEAYGLVSACVRRIYKIRP